MSSNNYEIAKQSLLDEVRNSRAQDIEWVLCPSLDEIFLESAQLPPATEPPGMAVLSVHEQGALLQFVENTLKEAELNNGPPNFEDVPGVLLKLWHDQSEFLTQATEALANGSRNRQYIFLLPFHTSLHFSLALSFSSSCVWPIGHFEVLP